MNDIKLLHRHSVAPKIQIFYNIFESRGILYLIQSKLLPTRLSGLKNIYFIFFNIYCFYRQMTNLTFNN